MDREEFFLLIPAIIYGVALVDLLKVYKSKSVYWEIILWGSILMIYIIVVWLELFSKLELVATNKWFYLLIIVKSIVISQLAHTITPEEKDVDPEAYFTSVYREVFILLVSIVVINLLLQELFYNDQRPPFMRIVMITLMLSCVFINKRWLRLITAFVIMGVLIRVILLI